MLDCQREFAGLSAAWLPDIAFPSKPLLHWHSLTTVCLAQLRPQKVFEVQSRIPEVYFCESPPNQRIVICRGLVSNVRHSANIQRSRYRIPSHSQLRQPSYWHDERHKECYPHKWHCFRSDHKFGYDYECRLRYH